MKEQQNEQSADPNNPYSRSTHFFPQDGGGSIWRLYISLRNKMVIQFNVIYKVMSNITYNVLVEPKHACK